MIIQADNIRKTYGTRTAVDGVSFSFPEGRIVGIVGPNGSGKTTTLKALLGLTSFDGQMNVLGFDPRKDRDNMMEEVCFIADVALLPKWITVKQLLDFTEGVHPNFERKKAERYLAKTSLSPNMKVAQMSKGMIVQLHLALVMAIDAKILVLDEPTLGLDILYRKEFYKSLLEDYFDQNKTILITTHQVEEVEHILTDVVFMQNGRIVLNDTMDNVGERFSQVLLNKDSVDAGRALLPLFEQKIFGETVMIFDGKTDDQLRELGARQRVALSDLFLAMMKGTYV